MDAVQKMFYTRLLVNLLNTLLKAVRYGLITLFVVTAAGYGCRSWPLIKKSSTPVEAIGWAMKNGEVDP